MSPHLEAASSFVIQALNGFHLINFPKQSFASSNESFSHFAAVENSEQCWTVW